MTKKTTKGPRSSGKGGPAARGGKPAAAKTGTRKQAQAKKAPWLPESLAHPPKAPGRAAKPGPAPARDPNYQRESQRYADPIASRDYILQVLADADGPVDIDVLAQRLKLTTPERRAALDKRLGAMVRDGQLLQNRRGGFAPARQLDLIPGTVIANPEGFGFLRPDAGGGDDLFLPPAEMRKVMHGDRVLASITGMDLSLIHI